MAAKANENPEESIRLPDVLPVLPLKDTVVFPYLILPLAVGREASVAAVDHAITHDRLVALVTQKDPEVEEPGGEELHAMGCAGMIMRMLKLPDGRIRILVQGLQRIRIEHVHEGGPFARAKVATVEETSAEESLEREALVRSVKEGLEQIVHLGRSISPEVMILAANLDQPGRLADLAAGNLDLKPEEAQGILQITSAEERLARVSEMLQREIQLLTMQHEISMQARGEIDRSQREYYLRQQLKTIQEELGEADDLAEEVATYRRLAIEKDFSEEAREELERQIRRLERTHPDSAESSVVRTYLETLTGLPWGSVSEDELDLSHARTVLDEDHYGLEKVKERIVETLAVRQLNPTSRGPILCFVGPPGVGKTSLGRSIARALGRKFARVSLGGVRDEAEIRGHRRTYVGAMPGRILQGLQQAGTSNPVFMLDEIDKLGADYRGDPSSAMLEVLDPEQNSAFRDHYLGVAYDLSKVLFITTANLLDPIQPAFLDRMETIRLSGYTESEKLEIARQHLVPRQVAAHGLSRKQIRFTDTGLRRIISEYTREAGVRNLEREIATVCRKVAVQVVDGREKAFSVRRDTVEELLGPTRHFPEELLNQDRVGVATGLAWTAAGGDLLFIEALSLPGRGRLRLTGRLGEVMQESAQAALSYARVRREAIRAATHTNGSGKKPEESDLHIHVPAGSVPKDGPSAGITIATAIASVFEGRPVRRRVAMTGELTLRGDVLPVGGLKEKVLAAKGAGVREVILPKLNRRDYEEIPEALKKGLEVHFVEHMDEVLDVALRKNVQRAARKPR